MDPMKMLREGVEAVPQMKYLLAVGALVAMIAIVVSGFKVDPRIALFGSILILGLMTLVVIFAKVSSLYEGLRIPATVMTWFFLLLMIASATSLFTSVFWAKPLNLTCWIDSASCLGGQPYVAADPYAHLRTPAENQVIEIKEKIGNLRQYLLTLKRYPDSRQKLLPANVLGDVMNGISDRDLNPTRRYLKREYTGLAYLMAAAAEDAGSARQKELCMRAINACDEALSLFDEAKKQFQIDPRNLNAKLLVEWVPEDQSYDRTLYFRTEALCILAAGQNDTTAKERALETWSRIGASYRSQYPAEGTDELVGCIVPERK